MKVLIVVILGLTWGCATHSKKMVRVRQAKMHCEYREMGGIVVQVICPKGYFERKKK